MAINKESLYSKTNVLVLLSGGIDSTATVDFYLSQGNNVTNLFIDYGQISAKKEEKAVKSISEHFKTLFHKIKCYGIGKWKDGYIPARNAFLLHTALMYFPFGKGIIAIGIHSGTNYSDCSEEFISIIQNSYDLFTEGKIIIGTPFIKWNKREIFEYCKMRAIPLNLTYSCELGKEQPCGKCSSCKNLEELYA